MITQSQLCMESSSPEFLWFNLSREQTPSLLLGLRGKQWASFAEWNTASGAPNCSPCRPVFWTNLPILNPFLSVTPHDPHFHWCLNTSTPGTSWGSVASQLKAQDVHLPLISVANYDHQVTALPSFCTAQVQHKQCVRKQLKPCKYLASSQTFPSSRNFPW